MRRLLLCLVCGLALGAMPLAFGQIAAPAPFTFRDAPAAPTVPDPGQRPTLNWVPSEPWVPPPGRPCPEDPSQALAWIMEEAERIADNRLPPPEVMAAFEAKVAAWEVASREYEAAQSAYESAMEAWTTEHRTAYQAWQQSKRDWERAQADLLRTPLPPTTETLTPLLGQRLVGWDGLPISEVVDPGFAIWDSESLYFLTVVAFGNSTFSGFDANDPTLVAVPEPGAVAAGLGVVALVAVGWGRQRKKRARQTAVAR